MLRSFRFFPILLLLLSAWLLPAGAGMLPMRWEGVLNGSGSHRASGQVALSDGPYGALLTLKQLAIDEVPDGRVYLARGGDRQQGIALGNLKQFSGEVSYTVPSEVDPGGFDSVIIWCEKFQVEIGRATLVEAGM